MLGFGRPHEVSIKLSFNLKSSVLTRGRAALGSLRSAFCIVISLRINDFTGKRAKPATSLTQIQKYIMSNRAESRFLNNLRHYYWGFDFAQPDSRFNANTVKY